MGYTRNKAKQSSAPKRRLLSPGAAVQRDRGRSRRCAGSAGCPHRRRRRAENAFASRQTGSCLTVGVTNEGKEAKKTCSVSVVAMSKHWRVPLRFAHGNRKAKGTWSPTTFSRTIPSPTRRQARALRLPGERDDEVARVLHRPPTSIRSQRTNRIYS